MSNIDNILKENKLKKEPFKVPEGYFEDFQARLNAKIDQIEADKAEIAEEKASIPQSRGARMWTVLKPLLYVAASIIALYGITYVVVQPKINNEVEYQMAEAEDEYMEEEQMSDYEIYFTDYSDVESEEFYEYLSYIN